MRFLLFITCAVVSSAAGECFVACVEANNRRFGSKDDACASFRKQLPRPMVGNSCNKGFQAAVEDNCKDRCNNSIHRMHAGHACRDLKTTLKTACFHGYATGSTFASAGHSAYDLDDSCFSLESDEGLALTSESETTNREAQDPPEVVEMFIHKGEYAVVKGGNFFIDDVQDTVSDHTTKHEVAQRHDEALVLVEKDGNATTISLETSHGIVNLILRDGEDLRDAIMRLCAEQMQQDELSECEDELLAEAAWHLSTWGALSTVAH